MSKQEALPDSWRRVALGDVVPYGATRKAEPQEIDDTAWLLDLEDIEKDTSRLLGRVTFGQRKSKSTKNRFSAGDVLYGKLRPYLNKVLLADQDGYCTTEIVPIEPNQAVDGRYLFLWLRHPEFLDYVTAVSHGLNMPRLGTEAGRNAPFVLAPIREQERIAVKLDAVTAKIDACRARLDQVPQILKRFREAVLEAAVSGRLTEEWRDTVGAVSGHGRAVVAEDGRRKQELLTSTPSLAKKKSTTESEIQSEFIYDIPSSWAFTTWGKASEWVTYGFTRPMPHVSEGLSIVTAKDVTSRGISIGESDFTTQEAFEALSDKDKPCLGDLLVTKDGTIGRAAIVKSAVPFCINQSVAVVWLRTTTMNKNFLEVVANAGPTQRFVVEKAKGMAIQHLSITDFSQCPVPVPPLLEQAEIVRRVDELFALADSIERQYKAAVARVEKLTPAVLAKAFRGELLPQDPNDEPAEKLLERIRVAREAEASKPTSLKRGRGRTVATVSTEKPKAQKAERAGKR